MSKIYAFFSQIPAISVLTLLCLFSFGASTAVASDYSHLDGLSGDYTYNIMRNGTQIGTYSFNVKNVDDTMTIHVKMDILAKVLFLTAYEATHQRTEKYVNGVLESIQGEANFNGKEYAFSYDAENNAITLNDNEEVIEGTPVTLTPFIPKLKGQFVGLSEKGKTYPAALIDHGTVKKKSGLKLKPYHHITFDSDVKRDLWYTPEGILDSLAYKKDGATITFERQTESKY